MLGGLVPSHRGKGGEESCGESGGGDPSGPPTVIAVPAVGGFVRDVFLDVLGRIVSHVRSHFENRWGYCRMNGLECKRGNDSENRNPSRNGLVGGNLDWESRLELRS